MPTDYETNRRWADNYLDCASRVIGSQIINVSRGIEDTDMNTDLIIFETPADLRFAFRVRRYRYLEQYGDEFTIRAVSTHGLSTELHKIKQGFGDFFLYAFAASDETRPEFARWFLGDLAVLRKHLRLEPPPKIIYNPDGTGFAPFRLSELPPAFIRDASWLHDGTANNKQLTLAP